MIKTNIRKLTTEQKNTLYNKELNNFIIYLIYKLGNGSMLKMQLEHLLLLFGLYKQVEIQLAISELLDAGLLLSCQFAGTNKNYLYLSKYCVARQEGLAKSTQATAVRLTDRGMCLNIFRVQNFMNLLMSKGLSVVELLGVLETNGSTFLYKTQDALNYYLALYANPELENEFTEDFLIDMNISAFETAHSKARKHFDIEYNEEYAKELKSERDRNRNAIPEGDADRFYFNFNNLLLSNVIISRIRKENRHIKIKLILYDIDNELTIGKAYEKIVNTYFMFSRYFKSRVEIECTIRTYNQDRAEHLKADAGQPVWDPERQKFKEYAKGENIMYNMRLLPSQMADIEVKFQNFEIEELYHILP